jgi:tripartite ATP-independent transporter DctM subunit
MDMALITFVIFASFLLTLFSGLPVAFCLIGIGMVFALIIVGPSAIHLAFYSTFGAMTYDIFLAIPLFVAMSVIIEFSGIASALYDTMYKWFGPLRGGLAIGTVVICTIIAAMTGLGATGVVTMGVIALPEMLKRGYDKGLAIGCIPSGGALGPLIPPSAPMITLAAFGSLSVGKMFIGGIIPGLALSLSYSIYIAIKAYRNPQLAPALPREERATWREKFISLRGVILPIILIIVVLGSIYSGVATPTEAGAVGAIGALLCALIYRQLSWKTLRQAVTVAAKISGMVMWLMAGGMCFSSILGITGITNWVGSSLLGLSVAPIITIIAMQMIGLILGCFIDSASITIICIPLFIPVVKALGFDPLWFGIVFTVNLIVGYITPPFGMNLFFAKGIAPEGITMQLIYRSVIPYVFMGIFVIVLCFIFPGVVLWLPNLMSK